MFENFVQYDLYLGEIAGNKSTLFTSVQRVHTHAQKYLWRLRNFAKKTLQQQANKHYSRWFLFFEIKIILKEDVKNLIECCMSFSDLVHEINIYIYSNWSVNSLKVYAMRGWGIQELDIRRNICNHYKRYTKGSKNIENPDC